MKAGLVGIVILLATPPSAFAAEKIDLRTQSEVYFSNPVTPDLVSVVLKGDGCADAELTLAVHIGGNLLFHRTIPMKSLVYCNVLAREPQQAEWAPSYLMNGAFGSVSSADRACKGPRPIGCWTSPRLEEFRKANAPLLCFRTNVEDSECIAYDSAAKAVIEVWRYSE